MATSAMDMASGNDPLNTVAGVGVGIPETPRGGQYLDETAKSAQQPPDITVESVAFSRVLHISLSGFDFDEVLAANDPDTGVIMLRVRCQTHPIAKWKRIGRRLIDRSYGSYNVERLGRALDTVIARVEAEFAATT